MSDTLSNVVPALREGVFQATPLIPPLQQGMYIEEPATPILATGLVPERSRNVGVVVGRRVRYVPDPTLEGVVTSLTGLNDSIAHVSVLHDGVVSSRVWALVDLIPVPTLTFRAGEHVLIARSATAQGDYPFFFLPSIRVGLGWWDGDCEEICWLNCMDSLIGSTGVVIHQDSHNCYVVEVGGYRYYFYAYSLEKVETGQASETAMPQEGPQTGLGDAVEGGLVPMPTLTPTNASEAVLEPSAIIGVDAPVGYQGSRHVWREGDLAYIAYRVGGTGNPVIGYEEENEYCPAMIRENIDRLFYNTWVQEMDATLGTWGVVHQSDYDRGYGVRLQVQGGRYYGFSPRSLLTPEDAWTIMGVRPPATVSATEHIPVTEPVAPPPLQVGRIPLASAPELRPIPYVQPTAPVAPLSGYMIVGGIYGRSEVYVLGISRDSIDAEQCLLQKGQSVWCRKLLVATGVTEECMAEGLAGGLAEGSLSILYPVGTISSTGVAYVYLDVMHSQLDPTRVRLTEHRRVTLQEYREISDRLGLNHTTFEDDAEGRTTVEPTGPGLWLISIALSENEEVSPFDISGLGDALIL